jgi:hypothetical protein
VSGRGRAEERSAVERALVVVLVAGLLAGCAEASLPVVVDPSADVPARSAPGSAPASSGSAAATPVPEQDEAGPTTAPGPATASGSALAALRRLAVKGRAPRTGYTRAAFGPAWADLDHNGCDTRDDVLRRDLSGVVLRSGTHGCVVARGVLADPYTGATVSFVRGVATSRAVQIDHVVALGDAWQKGAQLLGPARRAAFANDPLGLLAVGGAVNERKGDGDAATWLPPRRSYRCAYVARQIAVKAKYHLWVTPAERDAMARVLAACPRQPLPRG